MVGDSLAFVPFSFTHQTQMKKNIFSKVHFPHVEYHNETPQKTNMAPNEVALSNGMKKLAIVCQGFSVKVALSVVCFECRLYSEKCVWKVIPVPPTGNAHDDEVGNSMDSSESDNLNTKFFDIDASVAAKVVLKVNGAKVRVWIQCFIDECVLALF
jgi:hypothetical protein